MSIRKPILVFLLLLVVACAGCSAEVTSEPVNAEASASVEEASAEKTDIEQAVANFWNADYTYQKTAITQEDGEEYRVVTEGRITQSPYREYQEIVDANVTSSYTQSYYYGDDETVTAMLNTGDTWQTVSVKRSYPYGYGENLTFEPDSENTEDGSAIQAYNAQYEVDLTEAFQLEEPVTAVVTQTYYLDTDSKTLTRIDTDLTDLKEKTWLANYSAANDVSLSEAETALAGQSELAEEESLEITGYGEVEIELPSE